MGVAVAAPTRPRAVSCHLVGTPNSVFEGITASKGFVDYWNREAPPPPPGNADRTTFHVTAKDEE
jgi:hypothetical protein